MSRGDMQITHLIVSHASVWSLFLRFSRLGTLDIS